MGNISWQASLEGPLSFRITTNLDLSSLNENSTLSLSRFVEVGSKNEGDMDSGNMLALFGILIILTACSYIIYSGVEDADELSEEDITLASENRDSEDNSLDEEE